MANSDGIKIEIEERLLIDSQKLSAVVKWLEANQPDVFRRGLWEAIAALEADIAQSVEPMFWVRLRSDGFYEGPINNAQIEKVRKESGGWTPLFATPPEPEVNAELLEALKRCKFDSLNMSLADAAFCRAAYLKATS